MQPTRDAFIKKTNRNPNLTATLMILVSLASSVVGFVTSVLIARWLGADGFQEFSVAIAGLTLVATVCEFGTGKYALRIIPEYKEQQNWGLLRGYCRFSLGLVLLVGLVSGGVIFVTGLLSPGIYYNPLILVAAVFVPTTALVAVAAEFVMANRMAVAGAAITRLICPVAMLSLLAGVYRYQGYINPSIAIACFGISGMAGLLVAGILFWRSAGRNVWRSKCEYRFGEWFKYSVWFLLFAFLTSWVFRVSILVLHALDVADLEVARFAAALEIASLIVIVAKSTNKFYQPELAVIMTKGEWAMGMRMRRSRRLLIGGASLAYFLVVLVFGNSMLGWFGPEFRDGYLALCLLTAGTGTATVFSMAPEYLKFAGRMKTLLFVYFIGGISLVFLTWSLTLSYGTTGAAAALSLVLIGTTIVFEGIASWQIKKDVQLNQKG